MPGDADLARVGELFADRTRSRILLALLGGRELAAGVLAAEAGVSPATASAHLRRLVDGGLIAVRADGRHRRYRMTGPDVADLVERLAAFAPPAPVTGLRATTRAARLRRARTCYDHFAGHLGVGIMRGMLDRGLLTGGDGLFHGDGADRPASAGRDVDYLLTDAGVREFAALGVDIAPRLTVRYCVDWTETRHHLAGGAGRALCARFFDAGWAERLDTYRAVRITPDGAAVLASSFGVRWEG